MFKIFGGLFDYDQKKRRCDEITIALTDEATWQDVVRTRSLNKEKKTLESVVLSLDGVDEDVRSAIELLALAQLEDGESLFTVLTADVDQYEKRVHAIEIRHMFSQELDEGHCFMEIQSGAGGTEAQDWAAMLLRMYLKFCEKKGLQVAILEETASDVAGIKGATLKIDGLYAYGLLRTEMGIHRLVRKSPFDSNAKRHTSFASVFVYPNVDERIDIVINPADLRIDTYRASGAGGQHVNRTDSAVRITHRPTGVVAQCQNDRSQHRNKEEAFRMLKARLYDLEVRKKKQEQAKTEDAKSDISWGHQIRSYVLDQSRIKDLRTNIEVGHTQSVLDGDLDIFIEACLKKGF